VFVTCLFCGVAAYGAEGDGPPQKFDPFDKCLIDYSGSEGKACFLVLSVVGTPKGVQYELQRAARPREQIVETLSYALKLSPELGIAVVSEDKDGPVSADSLLEAVLFLRKIGFKHIVLRRIQKTEDTMTITDVPCEVGTVRETVLRQEKSIDDVAQEILDEALPDPAPADEGSDEPGER